MAIKYSIWSYKKHFTTNFLCHTTKIGFFQCVVQIPVLLKQSFVYLSLCIHILDVCVFDFQESFSPKTTNTSPLARRRPTSSTAASSSAPTTSATPPGKRGAQTGVDPTTSIYNSTYSSALF
jgi:hypothetical protein